MWVWHVGVPYAGLAWLNHVGVAYGCGMAMQYRCCVGQQSTQLDYIDIEIGTSAVCVLVQWVTVGAEAKGLVC